jgi:hypothetical protein
LVAPYITSCPSTNPILVLDPLPVLTLHNAVPGQNAIVHHDSNSKFIVFYSGFSEIFVPVDGKGHVAVPANMTGHVYAVGSSSGTEVTDKTIVAGPAVLLFN